MIKHELHLDFGDHELSDSSETYTLPINLYIADKILPGTCLCLRRRRTSAVNPIWTLKYFHLYHPSSGKFCNVLKRVNPADSTDELRTTLEYIGKACEDCSEYHSGSFRFGAEMTPDKIIFNHELEIDLLWLDNALVIHVVDTHTLF